MIDALAKLSGGLSPTEFLLALAVVTLSSVCVVLWRAVLRKDNRLSETHNRQAAALERNTEVLTELRTIVQLTALDRTK